MTNASPTPANPPSEEPSSDPLGRLVDAAACELDIAVDPAWKPAVCAHLSVILRHGMAVAEFDLPDETDPASVFVA